MSISRRRIETRDRDVARAGLERLWGAFEVEVPAGFEWQAENVELGPLSLTQGRCSTSAHLEIMPRGHSLMLATLSPVRFESSSDHAVATAGGASIVASPGAPAVVDMAGPIRSFNARLDPEFLAAHMEALTGEPAGDPLVFDLRLSPETSAYVERLCRFVFAESASGDALSHPAVLAGLLDSLANALLTFAHHNHSDLLCAPAPPSSRTIVRRVEEYLDEHASSPVTMGDLAVIAGAPVRSVESAFRIHRQGTPLAHLRSSRIRTARQALLSSPLAPVSSVAHASGFARVETFAAHYFKAFGERPEETRARALRESGPPPPRAQEDVRRARVATLSARQQEVCALVVRGLLNKQVAAELGLSERTVKEYRAQAMAKLGVTSLAELVGLFRDAGATEGA